MAMPEITKQDRDAAQDCCYDIDHSDSPRVDVVAQYIAMARDDERERWMNATDKIGIIINYLRRNVIERDKRDTGIIVSWQPQRTRTERCISSFRTATAGF